MAFNLRDTPLTAQWVLDMRREFIEVSVRYLSEGDVQHGTPSDDAGYVIPVLQNERGKHAELGGSQYLGRDFLRVYGEREGSLRNKKRSKVR